MIKIYKTFSDFAPRYFTNKILYAILLMPTKFY